MSQNPQQSPNDKKKKEPPKNFLYYSGMGVQMIAIILVGVGLGQWLDTEGAFPLYSLIFTLTAVILAMYLMVKDLIK